MSLHIVRSEEGDWIALYKDGKLLHQGHSIQEEELLSLLGIGYTHVVYDLEDLGQCPYNLSDLEFHEGISPDGPLQHS